MLNINNFWKASVGTFEEILEIPEGFAVFSNSVSSSYYTNLEKTHVVRVSDHWGSGINQCNWYLKGYEKRNSFKWPEVCGPNPIKIGIVKISDLIDVREKTFMDLRMERFYDRESV